MGTIGRSHFPQLAAGAAHDVGHAERTADLDQFAARHDHLASCRQGGQRQQHRGGVVVDQGRGLRAGDPAQQLFDVAVAFATAAGRQVELQAGWLAHHGQHCLDRLRCRPGAPQVGVQHGTGQVQHRHQPGPVVPLEQPVAFVEEDDRVERGPRGAQAIDSGTYALERERAAMPFDQPLAFG